MTEILHLCRAKNCYLEEGVFEFKDRSNPVYVSRKFIYFVPKLYSFMYIIFINLKYCFMHEKK